MLVEGLERAEGRPTSNAQARLCFLGDGNDIVRVFFRKALAFSRQRRSSGGRRAVGSQNGRSSKRRRLRDLLSRWQRTFGSVRGNHLQGDGHRAEGRLQNNQGHGNKFTCVRDCDASKEGVTKLRVLPLSPLDLGSMEKMKGRLSTGLSKVVKKTPLIHGLGPSQKYST